MLRLLGCLLLIGWLARPLATHAQTAPPAPPLGTTAADEGAVLVFNNWYLPRYQASAASGADTTGALLALFRKRRYSGGFLYLVPFTVGISLALPLSRTDQYGRQQRVTEEAVSPPLGSAILVAALAGFIAHATKFNKGHLIAVDRAYAAGQPIPARYRRLLRARHFAEAAVLREALAQQMARE